MAVSSTVLYSHLFGASRLDAEFYQPKYVENESVITKFHPTVKLGDITVKFFKGIFDIKAEEYVAEGIPFVRISNLKNGVIDESSLAYITPDRHKIDDKTSLKKYDLILSKTAYPAASLVQIDECNTSQDTIAIRTKCSEDFNVYLAVYLNTKFGLLQMERLFQGNIQMHISLLDSRTITIPVPNPEFRSKIRQLFEDSIRKREESKALYAEAEALLLRELGLDSLDLSPQIAHTANFSEAMEARRLDAEYFQPKYYRVMDAIKALNPRQMVPLGDLLDKITNGHTPRHHDLSVGKIPFLTAEHVFDFRINFNSEKRILTEHHEKELKRTQLREGDILITIKGRIGNAAIVEHLPGPTNINQDVALLRLKPSYNPYYVVAFLNSLAGKALIDQICTGQINPFLGLGNLSQIRIPIFDQGLMDELGEKIRHKISQAYKDQRDAELLLEEAKRRVGKIILDEA